MSNEEIIYELKSLRLALNVSFLLPTRTALEKAIECIEKQIPTKPLKYYWQKYETQKSEFYMCCSCSELVEPNQPLCLHCGQVIEWGEKND